MQDAKTKTKGEKVSNHSKSKLYLPFLPFQKVRCQFYGCPNMDRLRIKKMGSWEKREFIKK
jgi:hypothetical protein